jgi:transcriptional regulator with XRE-family HTH domain
MSTIQEPVGHLLRDWRRRRRLSQLDLACDADISARHLSFLETGRSQPSREMLLHLAEQLEVPLRERNTLLVAAGYAPIFTERSLEDPTLQGARKVVELVLTAHEPYPAVAVDRHWTLVASNRTVPLLITDVDSSLLEPPINVLRLSLHPGGMAPRIVNLDQWRLHVLARLRRQIEVCGDSVLEALYSELSEYQALTAIPPDPWTEMDFAGVAVPLKFATEAGILSFLSTTTVFGTPVDITLSELALESFFPADALTFDLLTRMLREAGG